MGGGGVTQSVETGAQHPAHTLTNSNKQRDTEQTLTPNTLVRTRVFCRRTRTQITSMHFPLQEHWAKTNELISEARGEKCSPNLSFWIETRENKQVGN